MAIVSSTYSKRQRNGGYDIIQRHTDSAGVVHCHEFWMHGNSTEAEIDARVASAAVEIADNLARAEFEELING